MASAPESNPQGPTGPVKDPLTGGPAEISDKVRADRELLRQAQADGTTWRAYVKLSGPGWLQSAITLGGGSLAGSLFLGVLGGTSMLWLQLVAIVLGVVMLSAISYVTLSTGRRPFEAINSEINPALGWGWVIATVMANMIFCMPQFSLCYDALDKNLSSIGGGEGLGGAATTKWTVTIALLLAAGSIVMLNLRGGKAAKLFDVFLKGLIGLIVICFFGVAILLLAKGEISISNMLAGMIPDFTQFVRPAGDLRELISGLAPDAQTYWLGTLMPTQRSVMISAIATAVGINMTFLLPYSMLARGWDKTFRGLARFDLATGMAIPFVLVTSCVVIAAASSFHNKIDAKLASTNLAEMQESPLFPKVEGDLLKRVDATLGAAAESTDQETKLNMVAALPEAEKRLAAALVKRDAFELSKTLAPLLGQENAKLVFGLGVFGMGFSTIIILMLINGYAFREISGRPNSEGMFILGVAVAGLTGASWVALWTDDSLRFWLAIFASTFAVMLLPIAYFTFFLMMNSDRILGSDRPTGSSRLVWNVLMGLATAGATAAAFTSLMEKYHDPNPLSFRIVATIWVVYGIAVVLGFWWQKQSHSASPDERAA
ncbi:divalent metal cation transporter [Allorhodopirellula heiligendammensis]|uniref:Natural resistance-associated macrophage protein n=1 Tax=Allorhodopirellula heiligendammensis TaxID=2714739 RepID=A0A5C6BVZ4_9BACT|nr:divalent metal cation transporter [Allorhodopirellula heiligendammensis]TWU15396.1 Natural resistance-associated macrophage protein [Allorhodopirellula heiligendammensis]